MTTALETVTGTYHLDPAHSRIGFAARHAMVTKVRGAFTDFTGTATLDAETPANSRIEVTIQTASVETGNAQRDEHLRTGDFFDVAANPQIGFVSTGVEQQDEENSAASAPAGTGGSFLAAGTRYRLRGDLTIKGVTKPVSVDFEFAGTAVDPFGNTRLGFEGRTVINRKDWGLGWNAALDAGGVLVSEKITLEFDISAIRQ